MVSVFRRVNFKTPISDMKMIFSVCALGVCLHACLAESIKLPTELADASMMLYAHFCTGPCAPAVPEGLCQRDICPLCTGICGSSFNSLRCFADDADDNERLCSKYSQDYVCEYTGAVVCSDETGTCIHRNTDRDVSFCVCKTSTGWEPVQQASCRVDSPTPTTPSSVSVVALVITSCLSVTLTLLVVVLVCFVYRTGFFCYRGKFFASDPKTGDLEMPGSNPGAELPDQSGSDPVDYSYAYSHRTCAPVTDPQHIKDDPDLDEQQEDHYYSRLEKVENQGILEINEKNTGPETEHGVAAEETGDADVDDHYYFKLNKMSEPGDDEKDLKHRGQEKLNYVQVQPDQSQDTGYEIARAQAPDDVKSQLTNHSPGRLQDRDSGYEVANVSPKLQPDDNDVVRFTYFVPEPNLTASGSAYEEVSEVASQRTDKSGTAGTASDYDHLQRPDHEVTTESAVKQ